MVRMFYKLNLMGLFTNNYSTQILKSQNYIRYCGRKRLKTKCKATSF